MIAEGLEPASTFPYGPYPADKLTYKNKDTVEYTTPPNTEGMGTESDFVANAYPVKGVVILYPDEYLSAAQLSVRLPPEMSDLIPVIIRRVEQDTSQSMQPPSP